MSQPIPIRNDTETDWKLYADIQGNQFSGKREITVLRKSKVTYLLQYDPKWMGDHEGQLTLTNNITNEKYIYKILAHAEEPCAIDTVTIDCKARQTVEHMFRIRNTDNKPNIYKIESDLPNISGKPTIELAPNESKDYELTITPAVAGKLHGSLTFTDSQGKFQWYAVTVKSFFLCVFLMFVIFFSLSRVLMCVGKHPTK